MIKSIKTATLVFNILIFVLITERAFSLEKCYTSNIIMERDGVAKTVSKRPQHDTSAVSLEGHFRVHYDISGFHSPDMSDIDSNTVPDYIDSTMVYFEFALDIIIDQLGYRIPLNDNGLGGGDEIDIYVQEYSSKGYGATQPDDFLGDTSSAFIYIDNNFAESQYGTKGYDALRITAAHELFHVVHYAYAVDSDLMWWMEQSSVWMEEIMWEDANDYFFLLKYFFYDTETNKRPIDYNNGNFIYGAAIWPIFLALQYGNDIIRKIWEALSVSKTKSIQVFDSVLPGGLAQAFHEFAIWNYFTGQRFVEDRFYPDSAFFDAEIPIDWTTDNEVYETVISSNYLTSSYGEIILEPNAEKNDLLKVIITPQEGSSFLFTIILFNNTDDFLIQEMSSINEIILDKDWGKAVIVTSCTEFIGLNNKFTVNTELIRTLVVQSESTIEDFKLDTYPNPFNQAATISLELNNGSPITVNIYSITGQRVAEVFNGFKYSGTSYFIWKPENVSTGMYFVKVVSPYCTKTRKLLYFK